MRWRRRDRARAGGIGPSAILVRVLGLALVLGLGLGLGRAAWRWWQGSDPGRVFARADAAFKAGRFAEADAALRRLKRLMPPSPPDEFLRGEVAVALHRPDEALAALENVPDEHPLAPLARLLSGQVEIRRGRARPAEKFFQSALGLFPNAVQPRKELVFIYNIQHRQAELDRVLGELLDLNALDFAYVLHWTKTRNTVWNPRGDLPALEQLVASDPDDRFSRLSLAEALRRLNQLDDAERMLAPLGESDPQARAQRILIAMDRGDLPRAEALLGGGTDGDPTLAHLRGQLALRQHDAPAAIGHFRAVLAADPIDRAALLGLATALGLSGRHDEARPYLEAARRHDALWKLVARAATTEGERDPDLPRQLGLACAAIGRDQEARAWLQIAIKRNPLDAESQRALATLAACARGPHDARVPIPAQSASE